MNYRLYSLFLIAAFALQSCSDETSGTVEIIRPTNLQVSVEVSQDVEGRVDVDLNANFANYYEVVFYNDAEGTAVQNNDGAFSYTFNESGTYAIRSRAYASFAYYVEQIDSVTVTVSAGSGGNSGGIPTTGYSTPLTYPGYTLTWNDEFDGTSLSTDWIHETGTGQNGWGNNELQTYRPENTEVRDGYLIITAKNEQFGGRNYTSSRLITQGKQSFKYGRIDIRAAMPEGQGLWPALWMLGDDISTVGWPRCGEIDIMEMVGGTTTANRGDEICHGTAHWDQNGTKADFGNKIKATTGSLSSNFHVYTIIWDQNAITWYFDDVQYHQIDIRPSALHEFREEFFFIMNVAVGGNWPGGPNASTVFPQQMVVDYVRVFQ